MTENRDAENRINEDLEGLLDRHYVEEDVVTTDYELPPPVAEPPSDDDGGQTGPGEDGHAQ